jgi:hypothetical protein
MIGGQLKRVMKWDLVSSIFVTVYRNLPRTDHTFA